MDFETQATKTSEYETERNKPMPSFNHGSIQANLIIELAAFKSKLRIVSELSLELSDWPSVPDISLYPWKKLDTKNDHIKVSEPPLCAIEILSPTQSFGDLLAKAQGYFAHGVLSCWIVLPGVDNIYVFSSPDDYAIFRSNETLVDKILDISMPLYDVFR